MVQTSSMVGRKVGRRGRAQRRNARTSRKSTHADMRGGGGAMGVVVGREEMGREGSVCVRTVRAVSEMGGKVVRVVWVGGRRGPMATEAAVRRSAMRVGGVMVTMVGGVAHVMRAFIPVFSLLGQVGLTASLTALVALGGIELLREGRKLEKFLASLAPLEEDLRLGVLPGCLIAIFADVLILARDNTEVARRQTTHDTAHIVLILRTGEIDQFLVHRRFLLVQGRVGRDGGNFVRLVLIQDLPR